MISCYAINCLKQCKLYHNFKRKPKCLNFYAKKKNFLKELTKRALFDGKKMKN